MSIVLAASLFLAPAASAAAQAAAPRAATPPDIIVEGEKPKGKLQCRYMKISGSRMPRRVCQTGDNSAHLMPGVSDNVGTRGRVVSGAEGEPEHLGMPE